MLRKRTAAVVATAALAAGVAVGAGGYAVAGGTPTTDATASSSTAVPTASSRTSVGAIYENSSAGVVEITATSDATPQGDSTFPFGDQQPQTQQAQGSGFVYDDSGHIVTNYHVVEGATSVKVTLADGSTHSATVVGTDPSSDLAVIKVDAPASELVPLSLADSDGVAVGDGVVAIGSPFGLQETVTSGIVSALDRTIDSTNGYSIPGAIQTDAAINHGNSGGPLLNTAGQVVGINSQIRSDSNGNEGVGFAIPSNAVRSVISQLISTGKAEHAYLGVSIDSSASNALLAGVRSGTPAAKAGLKKGDVVTAMGDHTISTPDELASAVNSFKPGDSVSLTYERNGQSHTVQVKLATRPS